MLDPDQDRSKRLARERQRASREREAAKKRRQRAREKSGGAVLRIIPVKNRNALISAMMNTRWVNENESENWRVIEARVSLMLDEFAEQHADTGELSPVDRQKRKSLPPSRP